MKKIIISFLFIINTYFLYSQSPIYPKNGTVKFSFFEGEISDTNKLNLTILYTNLERNAILMPVKLLEGDTLDPNANIYTEIQKLSDGKYYRLNDKFVDYFLIGDSMSEHKRIYNKLKPGDSAFLKFNLLSRTGAYLKGSYRMRVYLLNIPVNNPPYAPAEWTVSKWFYFKLKEDMIFPDRRL